MALVRLVSISLFALALLSLGGCEVDGLAGLTPDKSDYDFSTSCSNASSATCTECCKGLDFQTSLWATGDCGCAYTVTDAVVCDGSKDTSDACFACCDAAGYSNANRGSLNGDAHCRCIRVQKSPPTGNQTVPSS